MIVFNISDGKDKFYYKYPERASEITVDKLIRYEQEVQKAKPEILRKFEELQEEEERKEYLDSVDIQEYERALISYYMREIQFFTGMKLSHLSLLPVKDPEGIDVFDLRNLIRKAFIDIKAEEISSFKFLGKTYFLPPAPPNLFDENKKDYMRGSKVGEYATASELLRSLKLMEKGEVEGLLHIVAVLCRRKGEELPIYPDEQTEFIRERAKLFRGLDYQTVLNVGFFLTKRESNYKNDLLSLVRLREIRKAVFLRNTVST